MNLRYVPVLKNRQEEFNALKSLYCVPISDKILPLIEIVHEKTRSNMKITLCEELNKTMGNNPFMLDILRVSNPKGTSAEIKQFLTNVNKDPKIRLEIIDSLKGLNIIPVISYDHTFYSPNSIISESTELRKHFGKLAFRIRLEYFQDALNEVSHVVMDNDIIILDIDNVNYMIHSSKLQPYFKLIADFKTQYKIQTVIINSIVNANFTNTGLIHAQPTNQIKTNLKDHFKNFGFDAFGDYTISKNELPPKGGSISPGFVYYNWRNNDFIGFKGRYKDLDEFGSYILPALTSSSYWSYYSSAHKRKCPTCITVNDISNGKVKPKNQALWKRMGIMHYIFTLDEFLL